MHQQYITDIQDFLAGNYRNKWIEYDNFRIYVRKAVHNLEGKRYNTFDVANVHVSEKYQKQGIFTGWLTLVEQEARKAGLEAVYVESLLNPLLANFLAKRGYTKIGDDSLPNYYLMLT